ncbi:MAG: hypothetical protein EPN38_06940 [Rhodanobacteraceae bacterium]|nr:MAG: hypothetical protein EPN38_06940 [Rhodanobacteraceae bacterium]
MNLIVKLSVVALLGAACAACSNPNQAPATSTPATPAPTTPSQTPAASAIPMQAAPAAGASAATTVAPPATGPALGTIMQRPSFQQTFAAMDGAASLPDWARTGGGTNTPSSKVQLDGQTVWLAHACQTSACADGQLYLLVNPVAHTMQGLFIESSGTAGASVQKLTWLGKPDAATRAYLKGQAAHG